MKILETMTITCIENKCVKKNKNHNQGEGLGEREPNSKDKEQNLSELHNSWNALLY